MHDSDHSSTSSQPSSCDAGAASHTKDSSAHDTPSLEDLRRAKEMAETASQEKSRFLAYLSHEMRTPLSALLGLLELAQLKADSPKTKEYLVVARQAGQTLLRLINDMLDLAKVEAGQVEIVRRAFSLRETLAATLGPLEFSAQAKGLRLRHDVGWSVPDRLVGDPGRLGQALTNLVGNAVKFTDAGEIVVTADVEQANEKSARLLFRVADQGRGVAEADQARIFGPFIRAGAASGLGLGLSIVKTLASCMDGEVGVASAPGGGSVFSFSAVFDLAGDRDDAGQEAKREAPPSLRILLAEDDALNRLFLTEMLSRRGHQVEMAKDGLEALEKLRRGKFDVALMDARMPGLDGAEATRRIRQGEAGDPRLPIIALTACAMRGDRERLLAAGMDDYLAKPVDMQALDGILAQIAGKARE